MHVAAKLVVNGALAGLENLEPSRDLCRSLRWTSEGVVYESVHRHEIRFIAELGLTPKHVLVSPALHESRNARKKADYEDSARIQSSSAGMTDVYTIGGCDRRGEAGDPRIQWDTLSS